MRNPRLVITMTVAAVALAASVACGGAGTPDGPTRPPVIVKTTPATKSTTKVPTTAPTTPEAPPVTDTPPVGPAAKPRSASQQNADKMAASYLENQSFPRKGLIDQLTYEGFTKAEAISAVDSLHVDWNEQAVLTAKTYLDGQSFSRKSLIAQLEFEGFTAAQAKYGVSKTGL